MRLPLIADGELRGPATVRRHEPQIVSTSDVGDENDALAIRRPGGIADLAGHIQALERKALFALFDISVGLGTYLPGIGDCARGCKSLRGRKRAHDENRC